MEGLCELSTGCLPRPCGQVLMAAGETQSKKMSREAGLSGEQLESDSWESQRMGAGFGVTGCFPFFFLQVLCTRCLEITSREQHRIPRRSRTL